MRGWCLSWKERPAGPPAPVDGRVLDPVRLCALDRSGLGTVQIQVGRGIHRLDEVFEIEASGEAEEPTLTLEGSPRLERLGGGLGGGRIEVKGDVGPLVGARMTAGWIGVRGSAGRGAGAGLRGGRLWILGSTGPGTGGPAEGETLGQRGGEILVGGEAGPDAGLCQRRGLLAVAGRAAAPVGRNLRAGTILLLGGAEHEIGPGMRRGSIVLLGKEPPELLPGFSLDGPVTAGWLRIAARRLEETGFPRVRDLSLALEPELPALQWTGDRLALGRGEILHVISAPRAAARQGSSESWWSPLLPRHPAGRGS